MVRAIAVSMLSVRHNALQSFLQVPAFRARILRGAVRGKGFSGLRAKRSTTIKICVIVSSHSGRAGAYGKAGPFLQPLMLAVRFLARVQGDDAVEAPVSRARVEQQHRVPVQAGHMRMPAADDVSAAAQAFIQQPVIIMMSAELIAVAYQEPDIPKGCFNQALAAAGTVHVAGYAQNHSGLRQPGMLKIPGSVAAVNQICKGLFAVNNSLQADAGAMTVGND
jgi:stalled ribosome alternative rescue factor ArfA